MSRTSIDLDDRLVEEGMRVFRCKSKRELVHLALSELLKADKQQETQKIRGQVRMEEDLKHPIPDSKRRETFRTALEEANKRYGPALKKLAE